MLITVGHSHPEDGLVVSQTRISDATREDGTYLSSYRVGTDAQDIRDHLFDNPGMVTHLGGNTAILDVVNPIRDRITDGRPSWVTVEAEDRDPAEAEDFERFLSDFWRCTRGAPADVEDTHYTLHNNVVFAPGDAPTLEGANQ